MGKYIIDTEAWSNMFEAKKVGIYGIGDDIVTDGKTVWSIMFSLNELEELNSDYINEHFSNLQDTAYQKGFTDGKTSAEKGCDGCKHEHAEADGNPCRVCRACTRGYIDQYEPMHKEDDPIKVGDEVIWTTDNIKLIVTSMYEVGSIKWCDGVAQDGKVYSTLIENNQKTGKHYDIQSILEAMKQ